MKKIIDISVPIKEGIPVWPKAPKFQLKFNPKGSVIRMDVHTGTHIDAPLHFIPGGDAIDRIGLDKLIGPAAVVYLPKIKSITAKDLAKLNLAKKTKRLLFKTSNSHLWQKRKFQRNYVGLTPDAASWVVGRGIQLVGIDYLSIAQFDKAVEVHRTLLKNKVVVLEGLNLSKVEPGIYQLICLPLKLSGAEAAPARAILLT